MKKFALSTALAVGVLMAPALALAEGAVLWSNDQLPGYTFDHEANQYYKVVDIDPDLAQNISKWKMRIERSDRGGVGFTYDHDEKVYIKQTLVAHNPLTDGPNFCTHIEWSDKQKKGYTFDHDANQWYKVSFLTIALAKEKGLR